MSLRGSALGRFARWHRALLCWEFSNGEFMLGVRGLRGDDGGGKFDADTFARRLAFMVSFGFSLAFIIRDARGTYPVIENGKGGGFK